MIAAEYLNNFFLGYLPYVALTVLATGTYLPDHSEKQHHTGKFVAIYKQ